MGTVKRVNWAVYDGAACVGVGSVLAEDDRTALELVLRDPPVPLKPGRYYRVRVGSVTVSVDGSEGAQSTLQAVGGVADSAALAARDERVAEEERERLEREARELALKHLSDERFMEAMASAIDWDKYAAAREASDLGTLAPPFAPATGLAPCPLSADGSHGPHAFDVTLEAEPDPASMSLVFTLWESGAPAVRVRVR